MREDGGKDVSKGQRWTEVEGFRTYFGGRTKRLLMDLDAKNEREKGIQHAS